MFYLFAMVFYFLCNNFKQQHVANSNDFLKLKQEKDQYQKETKILYQQIVIIKNCLKKEAEKNKATLMFIDTHFKNADPDNVNELKKIINTTENEIKQLSCEIQEVGTVPLANRLKMKYPNITEKEVYVAVYTYYGYDDKKISQLISLSVNSVARYRITIKEKMGFGKQQNLKRELKDFFD